MIYFSNVRMRTLALLMAGTTILAACAFSQRHVPVQGAAGNAYVEPGACAQCHAAIAASYAQTGMAHSFYRPSAGNMIEDYTRNDQFYHDASGTYFSMSQRDGRYFQKRWQIGYGGEVSNVEELRIDYVMGSGDHARTYLHRNANGTLTELPLAWYAEKGGHWGMNPGYDNPQPPVQRTIPYECMFCHNGYPTIPEPESDTIAYPVFSGEWRFLKKESKTKPSLH